MNAMHPETLPRAATPVGRLDRLPPTKFQFFWVTILGLGYLIETFDNIAFGFVAPTIRSEWGLSIGQVGLVSSSVFLGMFVGALGGGRLSDKFGRKPVLIWSSVFYSGASLLSAVAPNYEVLVVGRVLTGVGVQAATGVIMVYLSEMFPSASRGRFFTVLTFIGFVASPLTSMTALAIVPSGAGAWRWVFALGSAGVVIAIVAAIALPETVRWLTAHGRDGEADRLVARLEHTASRRGPLKPVEAEPAAPTSGPVRDLFQPRYARRLVVLGITFAMLVYCLYGFTSWVPTVLVGRGLEQADALQIATTISFGSLLAPVLLFALADRVERKHAILGAGAITGIALIIFGMTDTRTATIVSGFVVQVGLSSLTTSFYTYLPEVFPTSVRGVGAGVVNGAGRLAGIASGVSVAAIYASQGAQTLYIALGAGLIAMGCIAGAFGPATTQRPLEAIEKP
ncbi:MFS transporter [Arthrobacter sp. M4]|uniref:MFS transporter n=1 Tax=Arthrobacter sp. M4 TaxID=218160 RepID=UPI001CDCC3DA|nr:MFS transporter [Arthrobacter sp. M4]MCA4135683.1 MFS transporter [Arthrobacter sp. M4]